MIDYQLTNDEIARRLAEALRAWRISPAGAGLSQEALARESGIGLTPLRRFEKTGGITLRNLISILRTMNLLENLDQLVPDPESPGPLEILEQERKKTSQRRQRVSTPRKGANHG